MSISKTTYDGLPTVANGLGTPTANAFGHVTATGARGVYRYVTPVDSSTTDMWFPAEIGCKTLTYVTDASGNQCRISCGINSDTTAIVTSRGWTDNSTGAGSGVADSGSDIRIDCAAVSSNVGLLTFDPVISADTDLFIVLELDCPSYTTGTQQYYGGSVQFQDSTKRTFYSQTRGAANTVGWAASGNAVAGAGNFAVTAFDRVFANIQWDPAANASDLNHAWAANVGRGADPAAASHCEYDDGGSVGSTKIHIQCDFLNGVAGHMIVREFHVFEVS